MALALLDGTAAAMDFTTSGLSWKCFLNYISADINRRFFDQTTFCSGTGWVAEIPGLKQVTGVARGFMAKGVPISDPMYLFASNTAVAFVLTWDTGCTYTGNMFSERHHGGMTAAQNSELELNWRSTGSVSSAWVIA